MYVIEQTKTFQRGLQKLQPKITQRVLAKLMALAENPYAPNNNVKAMKGDENLYRLRVGDLRVVYALEDKKLVLLALKVEPRSSVYN